MTAAMDLAAVIALFLLMTTAFVGLRMRLRSHLLEPTIQESPINYNTSAALNGNTNRDGSVKSYAQNCLQTPAK